MIYVEKSAENLPLTKLVAKEHNIEVVDNCAEVEDKKSNVVISNHNDNFVHRCPATNIYRCCNYHVVDIMQGCPFDCAYCILQLYLPHKYIKVAGNTDNVLSDIKSSVMNQKRRIGSGELSDSLAMDKIIPLSKIIVPFVNKLDNILFEFKTKSDVIDNLLNLNPKNVMVSWSLNPASIIEKEEPYTASLERRLKAAETLSKYGYKTGFHFDPLIMTDNFEKLYGDLIENLTSRINEESVEYISISTFRCPSELMNIIRQRKNPSILTKGDFIKGIDSKTRYFKAERIKMIRFVTEKIKKYWKKPFIYYCMEHSSIWENILNYDPGEREEFEAYFPCYHR